MLSMTICLPPASDISVHQNLVSWLLTLEVRKGSDKKIKGLKNGLWRKGHTNSKGCGGRQKGSLVIVLEPRAGFPRMLL